MWRLIWLLFFLSGISGLIYEVVWTRQLTYLFGATIYAVSTVLAAFMAGLALGSWLLGKVADRSRNPLRLYGFLEAGVGVAALLLPFGLRAIEPLYGFFYRSVEASFLVRSLVRFGLTFFVLLIPTTLMGGTLPVVSRFVVRHLGHMGMKVGGLYAVNTFGAVAGCFLSGFYLIGGLGIQGTTQLAAAINFAVFLMALLIARSGGAGRSAGAEGTGREKGEVVSYSRTVILVVLWVYFLSGFVALAYQVAWFRALVFSFDILKNTTYAFTAMLVVFLVGLAAGSAVGSLIADRYFNPLRLFGLLELFIGLAGGLSLFVIYHLSWMLLPFSTFDASGEQLRWWGAVGNIFVQSLSVIFLPTFLMGMAFPMVARICVASVKRVGFGVGRIYAFNTVGAILGAFFAGFFIIPGLGLANGILLLATVNVVLGAIVLFLDPFFTKNLRLGFTTLAAVAVVILWLRSPANAKFQLLAPDETMIFYKEGKLATSTVVENRFGHRTLYVDNVGVAGTDPILLTDQKSLAHLPNLLLAEPRTVLTVGFGSGGASYSYTLYPHLQQIDCIEICESVIDSAPYLTASNKGLLSLNDPRFRIIIDDVRSYLRFMRERYDIIATDCTDLRYKTNANLYDYEYFSLCRSRLTEQGMVVVWMPLAGLSEEAFKVALRTFYQVFPQLTIWYMNNEPTHYILLTGTREPLTIDYSLMERRLQQDRVREDLAEIRLADVEKLMSCFLTEGSALGGYLAGEVMNTENYPYLEFESPKFGYGEQPLAINLQVLLDLRRSPLELSEQLPAEKQGRLERFVAAVGDIIAGHLSYRRLELLAACRHFLKAQEKNPRDDSVDYLLRFPLLRRRVELYPHEQWSRLRLGQILLQQNQLSEAEGWLRSAMVLPEPTSASEEVRTRWRRHRIQLLLSLALCHQEQGNRELMQQFLKEAEEQLGKKLSKEMISREWILSEDFEP